MIEIKHLSIQHNGQTLVDNISFNIKEGEILGVVGESGSGKTLTALAIIGLLPNNISISDNSSIKVFGEEGGIRENKRLSVGMIFQEPMNSLNPLMMVGQQVAEAVVIESPDLTQVVIKEKVKELFKKVQLDHISEIEKRYPHELSGGQKQRVMIAIAISRSPKLLIADEPTTALDVTVQKEIILLLKKLQKEEKMSVLFISHDLSVVKLLADHCLVMKGGKQMEYNNVQNLFNHPHNNYTKALLQCKPNPAIRYKKLPVIEDFYQNQLFVPDSEEKTEREQRHKMIYAASPILKVGNICIAYPKNKGFLQLQKKENQVVNNISLDIFKGEALGLIGESGCGKTTIGKALIGAITLQKGGIYYNGKNIAEIKDKTTYKKDVQIIFQDPYSSLNPRISIGTAIGEPMTFYKITSSAEETKTKTEELLLKVGLKKEDFYKYPHEFSGGQRQRISIARALAVEPKILICDESVSALDVSIQAQIINLLKALQKEYELTYVFISHDLSVVKYFCDRMIVLSKTGSIEEEGECDQVYNFPKAAYTKTLIASIP